MGGSRAWWVLGTACIAMAGATPAAGQSAWELGVRGGVHRSTAAFDPSPLGGGLEDVSPRTSWTAGGFLRLGAPGAIGVRVEATYARKGFASDEGDGETARLDLDYVEVPVLVGIPLGDGPVTVEPFAGLWWAQEVGCDLRFEAPGTALTFDCDQVPDDPVERKSADWGGTAGLALTLRPNGSLGGMVDLRYAHSFRNIDDGPDIDNQNVRLRGLAATVGVTWRPSR